MRWLTNRVLAARVEQLFRGTAASSKAGLGSRLLFSRIRRQMGELSRYRCRYRYRYRWVGQSRVDRGKWWDTVTSAVQVAVSG